MAHLPLVPSAKPHHGQLSGTDREKLAQLVTTDGERVTRARLQIHPEALARALAGLPIRPATIAKIQKGLAAVST